MSVIPVACATAGQVGVSEEEQNALLPDDVILDGVLCSVCLCHPPPHLLCALKAFAHMKGHVILCICTQPFVSVGYARCPLPAVCLHCLAHIPRHIPKPSHQCGNVQEGPGGGGAVDCGVSLLFGHICTPICTASGAEDEEEDLFDKYSDMEDVPVITRGVFQQGDIRHVQRAQKGNVGNNPWVVADQIGKWGTISNRTCSQLERPASSSPMMKTRRRRSGCR